MHFVNCLIVVVLLALSQLSLASPNNEGDNRARLLRFVSLIAGSYYDGKENPVLTKTVLPVQANAFYPSLTIYLEDNEKPEPPFRQLLVLRERPDGYIAITPYFFPYDNNDTGIDVSIFQKLQRSDYWSYPNCELVITEIEDIYMFNWPLCGDIKINYMAIAACDLKGYLTYKNPEPNITAIFPVLMYKTERLPLLPSMLEGVKNFEDPCA